LVATGIAGFAASVALSSSLSYFWSFINIIQITTHLPLISEKMPSNVLYMYSILLEIASFNFLPYELFEAKIFQFPDSATGFNN